MYFGGLSSQVSSCGVFLFLSKGLCVTKLKLACDLVSLTHFFLKQALQLITFSTTQDIFGVLHLQEANDWSKTDWRE
jgi:hypothetical protein